MRTATSCKTHTCVARATSMCGVEKSVYALKKKRSYVFFLSVAPLLLYPSLQLQHTTTTHTDYKVEKRVHAYCMEFNLVKQLQRTQKRALSNNNKKRSLFLPMILLLFFISRRLSWILALCILRKCDVAVHATQLHPRERDKHGEQKKKTVCLMNRATSVAWTLAGCTPLPDHFR